MSEIEVEVRGPEHPMAGDEIRLEAGGAPSTGGWTYEWTVRTADGKDAAGTFTHKSNTGKVVYYRLPDDPGVLHVEVTARHAKSDESHAGDELISVQRLTPPHPATLATATADIVLWTEIRASTARLGFENYENWMDSIFGADGSAWREKLELLLGSPLAARLPFPDIASYKALKLATEAFMLANCGVKLSDAEYAAAVEADAAEDRAGVSPEDAAARRAEYRQTFDSRARLPGESEATGAED